MFIPSSTYRIQFNPRFNFHHLAGIIDYLDDLGITAIYASPILQPAKGSEHGYDGIDPTMINPELGTLEELGVLSGLLQQKGIGWIQDIVPNHQAFDTSNIWLKDVLERGINSTYSGYFDIDWDHPVYGQKLMTPLLGEGLAECIENGSLSLQFTDKGFFISYYANKFPVNIESYPTLLSGCFDDEYNYVNAAISALLNNITTSIDHWNTMKDDLLRQLTGGSHTERIIEKVNDINNDKAMLMDILRKQYYVLCHYAESHTQINYRRFFNVNSLICLRVEDEKVFDDYHRFIHSLYEKGYIQGLRIDHIDGLKRPGEYIDRLRRLFGPDCYIIVEKILDVKEELPSNLDIQGTSGYEFLSYVNQLITDNKGAQELLKIYNDYVPEYKDYEAMVFDNKLSNLQSYLNGEWDNLLRMLLSLNLIEDQEIKINHLKMALGAFMAGYPVYRSYIDKLPAAAADEEKISVALAAALDKFPELHYEIGVLRQLFQPHPDQVKTNNRLLFIQRLMQFTGPLAAKGIEDTTFYRYNVLISHNEVGDQPCVLGMTIREFHRKMIKRQEDNPLSLNCTSTHDTKRGEDNRVRINIISELAEEWRILVARWQQENEPFRQQIGNVRAPIVNDEYFLYQTIVGGYPEDLVLKKEFVQRTKTFFKKALRESKLMSDYVDPNIAYEQAAEAFIECLLNPDHSFLSSLVPFVEKIIRYANTYSMMQVIMKVTAPGIPDIYQSCELWELSYVDPDNRRPVDYILRRKLLNELKQYEAEGRSSLLGWAEENYKIGAQKLMVTRELLQMRKRKNKLFLEGNYHPLYPVEESNDVITYIRQLGEEAVLVALPLGIVTSAARDAIFELPAEAPRNWENIFTGEKVTGDFVDAGRLFGSFPVVVLESR